MTTQDRINELTRAALRAAPPEPSLPKPAVFRPSYEKDLQVAVVAAPALVPAAPEPVAVAPIPVAVAPAPAGAAEPGFKDEPNPEFQAMIEARDSKMKKKRSRQSLAITAIVLAALSGGAGWLTCSATGKEKMASLKVAMQESGRDLKTIGTITKQYDKQLEKIAVHGNEIGDATKAMGIDPTKVDNTKDPGMEEEMRQVTGEAARSTADRNRDLKAKFGIVQKIAEKNGVAPTTPGATAPASPAQQPR